MASERLQEVERLYHAALARPEDERAAFLDDACAGDDALRRDVASLLDQEDAAKEFLKTPALEVAARGLGAEHRPLVAGRQIGVYRILSAIGAGGMGEVYRARDTKLGRDVAIKVLPAIFLASPDRRARFEREARLLAALNHPHIGAIYGLEEQDGVLALVLELVDGVPLSDLMDGADDSAASRSPRGGGAPRDDRKEHQAKKKAADRVPLSQALSIARQIADALEAAHEKGIVHRDLKPANVVVTPDGTVKVLDFGIAKTTVDGSDPDLLPTVVGDHTGPGVVLGTAAYMSPEQARGKPVDKRTDIWAFGCVLFELLAGQRPFAGETMSDVIVAILEREPDWTALPAATPAPIRRLMQRCLEKDPKGRLRDIGDARIEIDEVLRAPAPRDQRTPESGPPVPAAHVPARWRARRGLFAVAAALLLLLAVGAWFLWPGTPARHEFVQLTSFLGDERSPTFSPTGDRVAFAWNGAKRDNWDIYVKQVDATNAATPQQITKDRVYHNYPAWSPDGNHIAFVRFADNQAAIYLTSPTGGEGNKLANFATSRAFKANVTMRRATLSWSPDSKYLAVAERDDEGKTSGIALIAVETGDRQSLISNAVNDGEFFSPAFSPDGRSLAYALCQRLSCDVYLMEIGPGFRRKGKPRQLPTIESPRVLGIAWTRDSQSLVYALWGGQNEGLWRVRVSRPSWWSLFQWMLPVAKPERLDEAGAHASFPAISVNAMAYVQNNLQTDLIRLTPGAPPETLPLSSTESDANPSLSPIDERIVFASSRFGHNALWLADLNETFTQRSLTTGKQTAGSPQWSWDSRWIAYDAFGEDRTHHIYVIDPAGGQPQRLTAGNDTENLPSWSRDDKWIYFASEQTGRPEIWRAPWPVRAGESSRQVTTAGGFFARESWNENTLYYVKEASGGPLFQRSVTGGPESVVLNSVYGWNFCLAKAGIYYLVQPDRQQQPNRLQLRFHDVARGGDRGDDEMHNDFELIVADGGSPGLSVSRDEKTVVYSGVLTSTGFDLMLIRNFR